MRERIVLASGNAGKLRELEALLAPLGFEVVPQGALGIAPAEESGTSFEANARIKALHAARLAGLGALADDSGLEVDALGGRPGVYSARYAGEQASDEDNLRKLLRELAGVPPGERTARYRCVIALLRRSASEPVIAEGSWEGRIATAPRGSGGFGYDPVFVPQGSRRTAAELSPAEKNAQSHRARALLCLQRTLQRPS